MTIKLSQPLAADSPADSFDVRQVKKTLNKLGYYTPYEQTGITGLPDAAMFVALTSFQADHNLPGTGTLRPDDDTVAVLNKAAAQTPEGTYIWRTVGDDKVRANHAELNGTVRHWSQSPDPGEDYNCRCWAEKNVHACDALEIFWINTEAKLFIAEQKLSTAEEGLKTYTEKLHDIDEKIEKTESELEKLIEKYKGVGAAVGLGVGAIVGGVFTRNIRGAIEGAKHGGSAGEDVSEGVIRVLMLEISDYKKEKEELLKTIKDIQDKITALKENVMLEKEKAKNARKAYDNCRKKS